jgi:DnaJ family protein C protein 28
VEDPRQPGDWEKWVDQQIREAQERGEFDNLPGTGKPLDLTPNPHAQGQELSFKILKDAGFAPEWIELDKAIRNKLQSARAVLLRQWQWREARLRELSGRSDSWSEAERSQVRAGWQDAVAAFTLELGDINQAIVELNLKVPSTRFQRSKLDVAHEVACLETEAS